MVKKLDSIFDCSRMMTPEHKRRIISDEQEQQWRDRKKPMLDAQEWELIDLALRHSLQECEQVTLVLFDQVQDVKVRGVVLKVDQQLRQIKFQMEEDYDWIKIDDVIRVIT